MAKSFSSKQLLAETNPKHLKTIALGSFLSFFVFLGSFLTSTSAIFVLTGNDVLADYCIVSCGGYESPDYAQPGPESEQVDNGDGTTSAYPQSDGNFYNDRTPDSRDAWKDYYDDGECDECVDAWGNYFDPAMGGGGGSDPSRSGGTNGGYEGEDASLTDFNCLSATGC